MCIGPVSLVMSTAHRLTTAINSRMVVAPERTADGAVRREAISRPNDSSPLAPITTTAGLRPASLSVRFSRSVESAKRSGSHRLAPP